jgi:hypothetical protein
VSSFFNVIRISVENDTMKKKSLTFVFGGRERSLTKHLSHFDSFAVVQGRRSNETPVGFAFKEGTARAFFCWFFESRIKGEASNEEKERKNSRAWCRERRIYW